MIVKNGLSKSNFLNLKKYLNILKFNNPINFKKLKLIIEEYII